MYRCNACDETWLVPKPAEPAEAPAAGTPPDADGSTHLAAATPHSPDHQTTIQRARDLIDSVSHDGRARNGDGR